MSNEVCLNPSDNNDYRLQVCEAAPAALPTVSVSTAPALIQVPLSLTPATSNSNSLWRDTQSFRSALLREAFPTAERRQTTFDSPLAYSLWSVFSGPAGCSSHPALEGGTSGGDGGSGSGDGGNGSPPRLSGFTAHDDSPCGAQGMITDLDEGL